MASKFNFRRNQFYIFAAAFVFVLLFGLMISEYLVRFGEERESSYLVHLSQTATASIDANQVAVLEGEPEEEETEAYNILKKQVELLHVHIPEAGFIYIMRLQGDKVVWLADSEPADSEDAVLPGEVFDEPSKELIGVLKSGGSIFEGPQRDKWGVWVTGLTAIYHPENKSVIALLGVDISAEKWQKTIFTYRLLGYALTASLLILVLFFYIYTEKMYKANETILKEMHDRRKAEEEVKELTGLLPICSSCKKIRDDRGYWNQIESYIEQHSKADFSH